MRRVYVLVEGPSDAAFLRRILTKEVLSGAEFVSTGGSSGIPSLGASVLVRRKCPVAVVMDSDSVDPDVIAERQQSTEDLIRAADASIPVKVVVAIPEIEAWFLETPKTIERMVGQKLSEEWLSLARRDPKRTLGWLAEKNNRSWNIDQAIKALDDRDIERIRAIPEVVELREFLHDAQAYRKTRQSGYAGRTRTEGECSRCRVCILDTIPEAVARTALLRSMVAKRSRDMPTAEHALDWFRERYRDQEPSAFGIDTLTLWSTGPAGWRPADRALRTAYPAVATSVTAPNSLYGAMPINGIAVAMVLCKAFERLRITETHPKVLYFALTQSVYDFDQCRDQMVQDIIDWVAVGPCEVGNDHAWDAIASAFAARMGDEPLAERPSPIAAQCRRDVNSRATVRRRTTRGPKTCRRSRSSRDGTKYRDGART